MKSSKSTSLKKLKEMFGITAPRTSPQRQRMITAARKALITPHISSSPSGDVVFDPSREDLLRIVNPTLKDENVREIQGRLADAEARLSPDPTKVDINPHILSQTMKLPAIDAAIAHNVFFPRTTNLTPRLDISPREVSRALFGDFSEPSTWSKKVPIVFSDDYFKGRPLHMRAEFNPALLSALPRTGTYKHTTGYQHGPKGAIFARASRTPIHPDFSKMISTYPPADRPEIQRSFYGKSPLETLMRFGRIHSDVAHELGHVPIAKPDDFNKMITNMSLGTLSGRDETRFNRAMIGDFASRVITPTPGSVFDEKYNQSAYPYQPGEWTAELRGQVAGLRGRGIVGHFQDAHFDAMDRFVKRRYSNNLQGMYLPGSEIVQFKSSAAPAAGLLSFPVNFDPKIPEQIRRHILPHLHDNYNSENLDAASRIKLINEAIETLLTCK